MHDAASEVPRRESRYKTSQSERVRVTLERLVEGVTQQVEAQLLDLSPSGARVLVAAPAQFQEAILLQIESPELGLDLSISANVNWLRPASGGQWSLGCSFVPQMPDRCIKELFAKGLLERRRARRRPFAGQATARWELDRQAMAVSLLDISSGGFSVLSPVSAAANSRMLLSAGSGDGPAVEIPAKVRWQMQVPEGFAVGCEFVTSSGYTQLRGALPTADSADRLKLPERSLSLLSLVGIVALVVLYCVFVLGR